MVWFSREARDKWNQKVFGVKRFGKAEFVYSLYWIASFAAIGYWQFWVKPENERIRQAREEKGESSD